MEIVAIKVAALTMTAGSSIILGVQDLDLWADIGFVLAWSCHAGYSELPQ